MAAEEPDCGAIPTPCAMMASARRAPRRQALVDQEVVVFGESAPVAPTAGPAEERQATE